MPIDFPSNKASRDLATSLNQLAQYAGAPITADDDVNVTIRKGVHTINVKRPSGDVFTKRTDRSGHVQTFTFAMVSKMTRNEVDEAIEDGLSQGLRQQPLARSLGRSQSAVSRVKNRK